MGALHRPLLTPIYEMQVTWRGVAELLAIRGVRATDDRRLWFGVPTFRQKEASYLVDLVERMNS
jgi:hypothetical protein